MKEEKTEIEKLNLSSMDIAEEKRNELLRLFPEIRTEGGKIDFEKLKLTLGELIEVGKERYGMNWPGKGECFKTVQVSSLGTLLPQPNDSIHFDDAENLIIEGDNLEVLKLLQKSYFGKVKAIYIDPPYNTGSDFIYPDDYSESLQTYLEYTGQADAQGKRFATNVETDGRFHSKWLNMIFPRLFLARNLLSNDGFIFVSIDENESFNLRHVLDEIYGPENFIGSVVWKKGSGDNDTDFTYTHEQILIYRKSDLAKLGRIPQSEAQISSYQNPDDDPRGDWTSSDYTSKWSMNERPNLWYPIKNPNTGEDCFPPEGRTWAYSQDETTKNIANNLLWWGKNGGNSRPRFKRLKSVTGGMMSPRSMWESAGTNEDGFNAFRELGFTKVHFPHPKPVSLLKLVLQLGAPEGGLVLDFFAGSGSTAHALLELKKEKGIPLSFILVQLPEKIEDTNFNTIADVTKERVKRVLGKLNDDSNGFRSFKLAESNFKTWNQNASKENLSKQLELHLEHVKADRTADDILYEILLKSGFPLTTKVEAQKIGSHTFYSIADGMLLVCLEDELTLDLIKYLADQKPERVVCLDHGFANNDQLKANAVQIFRTKGIASFKTI